MGHSQCTGAGQDRALQGMPQPGPTLYNFKTATSQVIHFKFRPIHRLNHPSGPSLQDQILPENNLKTHQEAALSNHHSTPDPIQLTMKTNHRLS